MKYSTAIRLLLIGAFVVLQCTAVSAQNSPAWSVSLGDFQYSMTMVASVRLDNTLSVDAKDRIGVFVGSELRGTGYLNVNVPSTNDQVAFIQIYSNQVSGETLSFKIYDASSDSLVDAVNVESFVDTKKLGENLNPFELTDNHLVTDINVSIGSIDENAAGGSIVATLSHNDVDQGQTHDFLLIEGEGATNNTDFTLSGTQLTLNGTYDYESVSEVSIRLKVVDSKNGVYEEAIVLPVVNKNDPPLAIALTNATIPENSATGMIVGSFQTTDQDVGDTHDYALVDGTGGEDNLLFEIDGNNLQVKGALDFETKPKRSVRVKSTDSEGAMLEEVFEINLSDTNESPTGMNLSNVTLVENAGSNILLGHLSTTDPDQGDKHAYAFLSGVGSEDNDQFTIRNGSELFTTYSFNFELKSVYSIRLITTDSKGVTYEEIFPITILDANDPPSNLSLSSNSLKENGEVNDVVGQLSVVDEDVTDTHTYSLVGGDGDLGNGFFIIDGDQLKAVTGLNHEEIASHSIRVKVTDSQDGSFEKVFSVDVEDVNDAPTDVSLSSATVGENLSIGTLVGAILVTDEDETDTHVVTLVDGSGDSGNALFSISSGQLLTNAQFDFEAQNSLSLRVQATDGAGQLVVKVITVSIGDSNDEPTALALSNNLISENEQIATAIGVFNTTDEDAVATYEYELVPGTGDEDNAHFSVTDGVLKSITVFNHELVNELSIRVRASEKQGDQIESIFLIKVEDVNEDPSVISLDNNVIEENSPGGSLIGLLETVDEDENEVYAYVLKTDVEDNAFFGINGGNQIVVAGQLNFEEQPFFSIQIEAIDSEGKRFEKTFNIDLINEPEAGVSVSNSQFNFGNVAVGESVSQSLVVSNTGPDGVLNITAVELPAGFSIDPLVANVDPGQEVELTLVFEPTTAGTVNDLMKLTTNAGVAEIRLIGQAEIVTGLEQPIDLSKEVQLGPNPASHEVVLELGIFSKGYSISLVGPSGQVLFEDPDNRELRYHLDVSGKPEGIYVIVVQGFQQVARKKIIIKR